MPNSSSHVLKYFILFSVAILGYLGLSSYSSSRASTPSKWEIYYGEINSVYSYVQIDTNFLLNKLEFLFIDEHQRGYCLVDTSSVSKADSLVPIKLAQIEKLHGNSHPFFQRIQKVPIDEDHFYIRLLESTRGTNLYELSRNKQQYYTLHEFAVTKRDTMPVIWTGVDSHTTNSRAFKQYHSKK